jgi:hypothetical protein
MRVTALRYRPFTRFGRSILRVANQVSRIWQGIMRSALPDGPAFGRRAFARQFAVGRISPFASFDAAQVSGDRGVIAWFRLGSSRRSTMESLLFKTSVEEKEAPPEPLSPEPLSFVLGRDHSGHWIVQETHGRCGGLFASKDAAISYARFESADRESVIRLTPDPIELNCSS